MPTPRTLSDDQLDELDEEVENEDDDFGSGIVDDDDGDAPPEPTGGGDDPEPEPEPEPEDLTDDEVDSVSVRDLAQKFGIELEDTDDEAEALESFFNQAAQLRDWSRQAAQERQQLQQQLSYYQQQQSQPPQQPQQAPTEEKPQKLTGLLEHWQNVPEWNDDWLNFVERDENGNLVAKSGADPTLPQKIMARHRWEEQAQRRMLSDPRQFVMEALQATPEFQGVVQDQIQEAVRQVQDQVEANQIAQQIRPYLMDQEGRPNAAGQAYIEAIEYAQKQLNVNSSQHLHSLGLQAARPYIQAMQQQMQQQQQAAAQKPETPREQKKRRQLNLAKKGASKKSNRGNRKSQNRQIRNEEDFYEVAMARMQEAGIDPYQKASS